MWASMGGSGRRLKTRDFNPKIGQRCLTLTRQLRVSRRGAGEKLAWDCKALAVDEVGR